MKVTIDRTTRRKRRISPHFHGTHDRPRISIYRSNKYIYAQAIDDENKQTVAAFSSLQLTKENKTKMNKSEEAKNVGIKLGELLKEKKITAGIFDRGQYTYNGRVKVLAEGLREAKLKI